MTTDLARRAGAALIWRGLAMGGEKLVFLVRLVILARLLSPEDFGLAAIGMTVLAVTLSLTDFGVVAALIREPAADKKHLDTAWTIGLLRGLAIVVALAVAAPWIAEAFAEPRATDIIRALALTAVIQAAGSIEVARLNRELRFGGLAGIRLAAAVGNTAAAVIMAPEHGAWALVWGAVAGAVIQMVLSYGAAPYRPGLALAEGPALSIARFGRWIFLIGVMAVAADSILRWMVATRLGVVELGLFFMAARLAFLPLQLITELVSEVAFPVYATLGDDRHKAAATFRGLLVAVAALLVPVCLVFAWLVPDLVAHLLGERWQGTVAVMQLLILSSIAGLLGDAVVPALKGAGNPARILAMEVLQLAMMVALGWPLIGVFGLTGAGVAWLAAIVASQFIAAFYARRLFGRPFAGTAAPLLAVAAAAALATGAAAVTGAVIPGVPGLLAAIAAAAAAAAIVTLVLDRRLKLGILQTVSGAFPWLRRLPFARASLESDS